MKFHYHGCLYNVLNKGISSRHAEADGEKPMRPHPYIKNSRKPRNAESEGTSQ